MRERGMTTENTVSTEFWGKGAVFTFHGFGKLDGTSIKLPENAIKELAPALLLYIWQSDYGFATRLSKRQEKALTGIAFKYVRSLEATYEEYDRRRDEAVKLDEKIVEHDKSRFAAIRHAVESVAGKDGKIDADVATPVMYYLLNLFIRDNSGVIGRKPTDVDMHFLRIPLTEKLLGDWVDNDFYEEMEDGDDD